MANAPDTLVLTGPVLQQTATSALLVTPTGGAQQSLASALSQSGQTSTNQILNTPTITGETSTFAATDTISAAGSTQATGTALTTMLGNVATVTAGQGVNLLASAAGRFELVTNTGTAGSVLYAQQGNTVDTINTIAGSIGVVTPAGALAFAVATAAGKIQAYGINPKKTALVANTASAAATLAASSLTQADNINVVNMTGSLAGGAVLTLPTVANYLAALPFANLNNGSVLRIMNSSAGNFAWTITANGSFTVAGTATVAQNTWRDMNLVVVNGTSVTATDMGGGNII